MPRSKSAAPGNTSKDLIYKDIRDAETARQTMLNEISQTRGTILEHVIQEGEAFWRLGDRTKQR